MKRNLTNAAKLLLLSMIFYMQPIVQAGNGIPDTFTDDGRISSFELYYQDVQINPGEMIVVDGLPDDPELIAEVDVKNISEEAKNVSVTKEEILIVSGMSNLFCWGLCYPPTVYTSAIGMIINSGETSHEFSGHVMPMGLTGTYIMKYTFFDEEFPDDNVNFLIKFQVGETFLSPPENLSATVEGNDVLLSWEQPLSEGLTGYIVYRDDIQITPFKIQNTSYINTNVPEGMHTYVVKAVYLEGNLVPSNTITVNIQSIVSQNFTPVWTSPYNPMTFYITAATVNEADLVPGDEIGIFDVDAYSGDQICVGSGVLTEPLTGGAYLEIIASMDDGSYPDQSNGFAPGNDFIFQLHSQTSGFVSEIEVTFPYPGYDEVFASQGSSFLELHGTLQSNQYFQPVWISPYNPMTIYALEAILDGSNLQPGDEIGIFDIDPNTSQEICVGFGILTEELTGGVYLEMIASMDDGTNPDEANGFSPGNDLMFKYYSQSSGLIENITFSFPYPDYDEVFTSQGNAFVELDGSLNPGLSFTPVWTSPYNPMTFYITEALLDGNDLNLPAQIGIFDIDPNTSQEICVGAATLTGIITPDSFLEIIASMNDGSIPGEANGFTQGHAFIFKFISVAGILIDQVSFSFPYSGYNEVFASQGNAIVDLSGTSPQGEQHTITLSAGWTGISSYLEPTNTNMADVTGGISGQLEMIQNLGAFYQPGNASNTLNTWTYQSGYFIKVNDGVNLTIQGNAPGTTTINLTTGWNLIPVLSTQAVEIETLFAGNLTKVEIIKEAVGLEIYWPDKYISTLQSLQVGKSYLVKVSEDFTITY